MAFGTSDDAEWLLQSPAAGVSEGPDDEVEIAVSVDVSGLEVGTYSAAIEISGGVLLIAVGLLMVTDNFLVLNRYLDFLNRFAL